MISRISCTTILGLLLCLAAPAGATVPELLNYQGVLTDTLGEPLDTTVAMTFAIHDAPTGGTEQWSETQASVTVSAGCFNVLLGSVNSLHDSVFAGANRYLEIQVGDDTATEPRLRLVSVAFAHRVSTVDGATGGTIVDQLAVGPGHTNSGDKAFVAGENNEATGDHAAVGGGQYNMARGAFSTVSGGGSTAAGDSNLALADYSTIGGGWRHLCGGEFTTIGGGDDHTAMGDFSVISGGKDNGTHGIYSTICGGLNNNVTGSHATIAGGRECVAAGAYAFIAGGRDNAARAPYSFAAGRSVAIASADGGSILFADSLAVPFDSDTANEFAVRCTGGARFVTGVDPLGNQTAGVCLSAGSGSWAACSDRAVKDEIAPVDGQMILAKLAELEISHWRYRAEAAATRHIGPMAQDFYETFGLGADRRYITAVDADGVALAAIQALQRETKEAIADRDAEIAVLRTEIQTLRHQLDRFITSMNGDGN